MNTHRAIKFFLILFLVLPLGVRSVNAQQDDPPTYTVQAGDTLSLIAFRFGVSTNDLIRANDLTNPDQLKSGDVLVIPGLEGIHGALSTHTVAFGETLSNVSRRYQVTQDMLIRLNRITSPGELYAGTRLIVPQKDPESGLNGMGGLSQGQTLLEMAAIHNSDPWSLQALNSLSGTWEAVPNDVLFFPFQQETDSKPSLSASIQEIVIAPLPLVQGRTAEIKVTTRQDVKLSGSIIDHDFTFFSIDNQTQVALQGVHALADVGPYPLRIEATLPDGTQTAYEQLVLVEAGNYAQDPHLTVDPATVDPKVTGPENAQVAQITTPVTPDRYWSGTFQSPGYDPKWITSLFGNRRMYNDDPKVYFHTGIDYGGGVGLPIHSPAPGVVVFAGPLIVRGNATIIDHGWGVYSGFWHQSEIQVKVGDHVDKGQQIGLIGGTGRVTGAHLHWEIWVNGVQVDPLDWLESVYP